MTTRQRRLLREPARSVLPGAQVHDVDDQVGWSIASCAAFYQGSTSASAHFGGLARLDGVGVRTRQTTWGGPPPTAWANRPARLGDHQLPACRVRWRRAAGDKASTVTVRHLLRSSRGRRFSADSRWRRCGGLASPSVWLAWSALWHASAHTSSWGAFDAAGVAAHHSQADQLAQRGLIGFLRAGGTAKVLLQLLGSSRVAGP